MAKAIFGEYAAYDTQGGIRFMKNSKLTSEKAIPSEVVSYLKKQLGVEEPRVETPPELPPRQFAPPTPEESALLKAQSLQTPPELQRSPEEMAAATPTQEEPLTPDDFDVPEEPPRPVDPYVPDEEEAPALNPSTGEPLEPADNPDPATVDPDFLESVSIHTASLQDMVEALYNRFGIYTVFLRKLPEADEINPLTAEGFTKYHLGIAYQASIYATNKGLLDRDPESGRKQIDQGREAAANWQVDERPRTTGEARRMNTFEHRTSPQGTQEQPRTEIVHVKDPVTGELHAEQREIPAGETGEFNGARARYDKEEDEIIAEPNFGKPIIRPNW